MNLDNCQFPDLATPYDQALCEAAALILDRFDVLGIIASGTIIRGNPGPSSDLDIYVVNACPQRQRIQKFFNGVPAEIFVNPVSMIEQYFVDERRTGRPITAHMLATGYVVLDRDPVIEQLRERAQKLLSVAPDPTADQLRWNRYLIASQYEDARDIALTDPDSAMMILGRAVHDMLQFMFWTMNHYLPRDKDLLNALQDIDSQLAEWARAFYSTADLNQRLALADHIAECTIQTRGFFEWESSLENV
jgi:predicted nucleotidyltransferase